ncbi:hypothetical protein [Granulicoccus sp. GXG6511]|uniref:hypothetical protein n=1 Tax=Granulicoccus sp. GXG6511 TaxID=3381351 RepID=UPI003D7E3A23
MLNITAQPEMEQLVSCGVPTRIDYRERCFGWRRLHGQPRDFAANGHVHFAHLSVNPLVPRPRAKHG